MTLEDPACLSPGEIIEGRYRISQLVEVDGGTARYTATHLIMGRNVTLEILCNEEERSRRRFQRAGRVLSLLRHPHVVHIHDMGAFGKAPYMVLEYLQGQSLAQRLTLRGAYELDAALPLVEQLLSALGYLHTRKIVHRDVAAHNLILVDTWDGAEELKVAAFALAKDQEASRSSSLNEKRALVESLTHVAPEQIVNPAEADHRVDLYAAGAVLYQMLTGVPPFQGETLAVLGRAILEEQPPAMASWVDHVPAAIDDVVQQAMAKDPEHRFGTAGAMWQALQAAAR